MLSSILRRCESVILNLMPDGVQFVPLLECKQRMAGDARKQLEQRVGHSVISSAKAADYLPPAEDVQELPEE